MASPPTAGVSEVRLTLARRLAALDGEPVSGELLAGELGLSRAAISNHLRVLRDAGFALEASPRRGYRLPVWPDLLIPEAVLPLLSTDALGRSYEFHERCASTNALAQTAALDGAPHGHTIVADLVTLDIGDSAELPARIAVEDSLRRNYPCTE